LKLPGATKLVFGAIANGEVAQTAKRARLNPAHSRWLMGIPSSWDLAAPFKAKTIKK
jgi:hypothetical protein